MNIHSKYLKFNFIRFCFSSCLSSGCSISSRLLTLTSVWVYAGSVVIVTSWMLENLLIVLTHNFPSLTHVVSSFLTLKAKDEPDISPSIPFLRRNHHLRYWAYQICTLIRVRQWLIRAFPAFVVSCQQPLPVMLNKCFNVALLK